MIENFLIDLIKNPESLGLTVVGVLVFIIIFQQFWVRILAKVDDKIKEHKEEQDKKCDDCSKSIDTRFTKMEENQDKSAKRIEDKVDKVVENMTTGFTGITSRMDNLLEKVVTSLAALHR